MNKSHFSQNEYMSMELKAVAYWLKFTFEIAHVYNDVDIVATELRLAILIETQSAYTQ